MVSHASEKKPHAVCVPYPAQGHVNPMLNLAKILHAHGFHITFVLTEFNSRRLIHSQGPEAVQGLTDFRFASIPDGLPFSDEDATQNIPDVSVSTMKNCPGPFKRLLAKLNEEASSSAPPVSCIVSDGGMSFTLDAARELGIPEILFWTCSACGFLAYLHFQQLVDRGLVPLKVLLCQKSSAAMPPPSTATPGITKVKELSAELPGAAASNIESLALLHRNRSAAVLQKQDWLNG